MSTYEPQVERGFSSHEAKVLKAKIESSRLICGLQVLENATVRRSNRHKAMDDKCSHLAKMYEVELVVQAR